MSNSTFVFGAADAKISALTSDTGSAPAYGSPIDVPGLKSISISGSSSTKDLRGDNQLLASIAVLESIEVTLEFAKWDADIYSLFTGATVTAGTGTDFAVKLFGTSNPSPFKLEAVSVTGEESGSNVSIALYKLIATDLPDMVGLAEEEFKTVSVTCRALPLSSTSEWLGWSYNSTATTL